MTLDQTGNKNRIRRPPLNSHRCRWNCIYTRMLRACVYIEPGRRVRAASIRVKCEESQFGSCYCHAVPDGSEYGQCRSKLRRDIWRLSQKHLWFGDGIGTEFVTRTVVVITQLGYRQTTGERVSRSNTAQLPGTARGMQSSVSHHRSKRDGDRSMFVPLRHKPNRLQDCTLTPENRHQFSLWLVCSYVLPTVGSAVLLQI